MLDNKRVFKRIGRSRTAAVGWDELQLVGGEIASPPDGGRERVVGRQGQGQSGSRCPAVSIVEINKYILPGRRRGIEESNKPGAGSGEAGGGLQEG